MTGFCQVEKGRGAHHTSQCLTTNSHLPSLIVAGVFFLSPQRDHTFPQINNCLPHSSQSCRLLRLSSPSPHPPPSKAGFVEPFFGPHYQNKIYFSTSKSKAVLSSGLCVTYRTRVPGGGSFLGLLRIPEKTSPWERGEGWERAQPPKQGPSQPPASSLS